MSKPIILSDFQWGKLRERLKQDYPIGVILIRSRMREVLGFTDREHQWWDPRSGYMTQICLDFYNEPKRTMFMLKYSEYLEKDPSVKFKVW